MRISDEFVVDQPVDAVWAFFDDIPQVAACLPGTTLTGELGDDRYRGEVALRMGPVRLQFDGVAQVVERDDAAKRMVVDAQGAEQKGRGQASMTMSVRLTPQGAQRTTAVIDMDLQLSGAAAQYGRGMVSDVTSVLIGQFAGTVQHRIGAIQRGEDPKHAGVAAPASGLAIGMRATGMALKRVFRRFFLPYQPGRA